MEIEVNVLSLFDGISCGRLALDRAGVKYEKYFASEIDKYALHISKKQYPDSIHLGDVNRIFPDFLPKIDLLIAGSPCQGFSSAGDWMNFEDPRSGLFWRFVELLQVLKPRYFLLENVCMKKEWSARITAAVGVEPVKINSALMSAQNRNRLYWTNISFPIVPDQGLTLGHVWHGGIDITDRYNAKKQGTLAFSKSRKQTRTLGHKSCAILTAGAQNIASSGSTNVKIGGRYFAPDTVTCERLQTLPDNYTAGVSNMQRLKAIGNGWTVDVVAHILKGIKNEKLY